MVESFSLHASEGDVSDKIREWSSLIGIVTAIVGNILISFALNIQRYAHIKLGQEQEEHNERSGLKSSKSNGNRDYGTQQSQLAEERAERNLNAPLKDGDMGERLDTDERNGKSKDHRNGAYSGSIHSQSSSDSTIKPSEKSQPQEDRKSYLKSGYWWAGIILMVCGEAGNFLAYGFAPASIVSPLGVVALVSNCIIAPVLLKERFRQRDFGGVAIAIAGAVTIVLSARTSETKMGPDDVWGAITRWEFETYLGITAALIIVLLWASERCGEKTILIDLGLVGLFGGYTALSTKGVASLLSDTLWRTLTFPITYVLVFVLVVSALAQIRYVNRALQRFDSTQVIPVQFVLFTISVIIGSAVLYRDFQNADASQFGKFFGGCVLTFLGVYLITSGRGDADTGHDVADLGAEEEAIDMVDEERYQDEVSEINGDRSRRKSSVSFAFDNSLAPKGSRRSSKHESPKSPSHPRSPPPLLSHTSTASSRYTDTESPLLENPWEAPPDTPTRPNRPNQLSNTISSPQLPSEAQRSGSPSTPQARLSVSKADRPSALSRRSMARLTPGPLMSPLSSSLSAVVADNLRKGLDSPTARRRPGPGTSGLRKSKSQRAGMRSSTASDAAALEVPASPSPRKNAASLVPENALDDERPSAAGRSKSVSATLGDFFRGRRDSKGKKVDVDAEAGEERR